MGKLIYDVVCNRTMILICLLLMQLTNKGVESDILVPPHDAEIQQGDTTTLICTSDSGYVRWKHVPFPGDEAFNINLQGDMIDRYASRYTVDPGCVHGQCNLVIRGVQLTDAGSFCCIDRDGRGTKICAELTVIESDPQCKNTAEASGVVTGTSCNIPSHAGTIQHNCSVSYRGKKAPVLRWKDSQNNTVPDDMVETTSTTNSISSVVTMSLLGTRPQDMYTCETTVSKVSCRSTIIQQYAYDSNSVLNMRGGEVECIANASVPCTYHWVRSPENKVFQYDSTLNLSTSNVVPGTYRCIADCNVRGHHCRITAMTVHFTSDEDISSHTHTAMVVILVISVTSFLVTVSLAVTLILFKKIKVGKYLIKFEKQNGSSEILTVSGPESSTITSETKMLNGHYSNGVHGSSKV